MSNFERAGFCSEEEFHAGMAYLLPPDELVAGETYRFMGSFADSMPDFRAMRVAATVLSTEPLDEDFCRVEFTIVPSRLIPGVTAVGYFHHGYMEDVLPPIAAPDRARLTRGYFREDRPGPHVPPAPFPRLEDEMFNLVPQVVRIGTPLRVRELISA